MELEKECSSNNLSRSKSYNDLIVDLENEVDTFNNITRKSFSRQGAFRRRTQEIDLFMLKRRSFVGCEDKITSNLTMFNEDCECTIESEKNCHKKNKNSFSSFTLVKDILKSFKRDTRVTEKEEIKRKVTEANINLNKTHSSPVDLRSQTESTDIKMFMRAYGEKLIDATDSTVILMESSWEQLVDKEMVVTKLEADRQTAIWEIIETESNFIKQLTIITHVFYPVLQKMFANYSAEFSSVNIEDLFGNINEVYVNHWTLWNQCISLPLSMSKVKRIPLDVMLLKEGICNISTILNGYISFMHSLPTMQKKIRKLQRDNNKFNQYIEYTKTYCRLYRDGHLSILSLPFQRITRYKILLERVRSLSSPELQSDINEMIESIHIFLQKLNKSINGKYSMKDIKDKIVQDTVSMMTMFNTNDVVSEDDLHFDIMRPLAGFSERLLIHEGRLKLKIVSNKTVDVHCFLCNDLIMICKPLRGNWEKLKLYKSPIRLDKLLIKVDSEGSFMIVIYNDFKVVDNVMALVGDLDEVKLWIEKCNKAREAFITQLMEHTCALLIPIEEKPITPEEYQRIWTYSDTTCSVDSTDSAFSQTSGCSTQTDCSCPSSKAPSMTQDAFIEDLTKAD